MSYLFQQRRCITYLPTFLRFHASQARTEGVMWITIFFALLPSFGSKRNFNHQVCRARQERVPDVLGRK